MPIKTWHFLLPASGNHVMQAEYLKQSTPAWRILLDGNEEVYYPTSSVDAEISITGPEDSQLDIRKSPGSAMDWSLYVNGAMVEECASNRTNSVRDFRNMPEGTYTIATQFRAEGLDLHVVRKFRFTVLGIVHELHLVHSDWAWRGSFEDSMRTFQVIHNGEIVDQKLHNLWDSNFLAHIKLRTSNGQKLDTEIRIYWDYKRWLWSYSCQVNHLSIPECWTRARGEREVQTPEVAGTASSNLQDESLFHSEAGSVPLECHNPEGRPLLSDQIPSANNSLPQGVSYDPENGTFQATMNVRGKFVLLGEFSSSEDAYQRYMEVKEHMK